MHLTKLLFSVKFLISSLCWIGALLYSVSLTVPGAHAQQTDSNRKYFRDNLVKAEKGDGPAQKTVAYCYSTGHGVAQNDTAAVRWYREAAEQGDASAQYSVGAHYAYGRGVDQDYTEALKWIRKAAEQNIREAQNMLGSFYTNGHGVERDYAEALKWYRKAAEWNNALAQKSLGDCYIKGQGVPADQEEALKWYLKAAEQNHAPAQFMVGIIYSVGLGLELASTRLAVERSKKEGTNLDAGSLYLLGIKNSKKEGYAWLNLAAKTDASAARKLDDLEKQLSPQEIAEAQNRTKELRIEVESKSGNAAQIRNIFLVRKKKAENGDSESQFILARAYAEGISGEKNNVEAYAWFNLNASTNTMAAKSRDDLGSKMSMEQVAAGEKRTVELRALVEANLKNSGKTGG